MSVQLIMRPQDVPLTWEQFIKQTKPFAIAIDGYVADGPIDQLAGPRCNFNHHERVHRLATRSTCEQILIAIRLGLFNLFKNENGQIQMDVYANDCDEDVCLSWFLLSKGFMAEHVIHPLLNRLVNMEGALDATAGAFPFPISLPVLEELAWIFDPYRRLRLSGELYKKNPETFKSVVTDVSLRIQQHLAGQGDRLPLNTKYETTYRGQGWVMVKEHGPQARTGMFSDGITAFVSVSQGPGQNWTYSVGRQSSFIPFNVPAILNALNEAEEATDDRWGGSDIIGGSPRVKGSKLNPDKVIKIIDGLIN